MYFKLQDHYGNFSMITWESYYISIYELNSNFTNIYLANHKIMDFYIDFLLEFSIFDFQIS